MVYRAHSRTARSIYKEKSYLKKRKTTTTTTRSEEYTHNRVLFKREEQAHVVCRKRDRTGNAVLSGTGLRETQIRTTTSSLRGSSARIKVDSCPCWRKEFQDEAAGDV